MGLRKLKMVSLVLYDSLLHFLTIQNKFHQSKQTVFHLGYVVPPNLALVSDWAEFSSRRKNRIGGFALKKLEQQFPNGISNLNAFFNWTRDRDAEFDTLRNIVQTLQHR